MEQNLFEAYEREKAKLPPLPPQEYQKAIRALADRMGL